MTTHPDTALRAESPRAGPDAGGGQVSIDAGQAERDGSLVLGGLLAAYGLAKRT